jgi:leader peptidase (prepilin peptidase)/N-methyltransferase
MVFLIICWFLIHFDLRYRILPDRVIFLGIILALAGNFNSDLGILGSVTGMLVGGISILIGGSLCFFISKKPALGGGDLKLLIMIGAFWGWKIALITFAIAPILGSLWAGYFQQTRLAYGLFLISSSLIALLIGRIYGY